LTNQTETTSAAAGFEALGISGHLLKTAAAAGFVEPKPIQSKAIPHYLAGRDLIAIAQTGSGKTAAFSLPILQKILSNPGKRLPRTAKALILAPTRELAVQIEETIRTLSKGLPITTALVLGGVSRGSQVKKMQQGVDALIATPGRLTDLVREGEIKLSETRFLVLDEADRMLDMGFINDVRRIAKATHAERQTSLYSATMPDEIADLAKSLLKSPVRVEAAPPSTTATEIKQGLVIARLKQKRQVLSSMLADDRMSSVIVFARTKHGADRVARDLERDGFQAAVIHGNKSQNARQRALTGFRDGSTRILVATDIAARGIDVPGISHVVNFDLPDEPESYVHRIGRTGRNGADGVAITLCDPSEFSKLRAVEKITRLKIAVIADHTDEPDPAQPKAVPGQRPAPQAQKHQPATREHQGNRDHAQAKEGRPNGQRRGNQRRRSGSKPAKRAA